MAIGVSAGNDRCRICGHAENNAVFRAREMMFGLREEFDYFQCSACRCLQIRDIPPEMGRYYPANYYSMQTGLPRPGVLRSALSVVEWQLRLRVSNRMFGDGRRTRIFDWMRGTHSAYGSAILDVGCGRGKLLHELRMFGFRDLTGADPFVAEPIRYDNGIVIHKSELSALDRMFDLIMMHSTFEHLPDPAATMSDAAQRLHPGRYLLLRIPLVDCYAWRHYGVNWFALDAPRHFYLHSQASMGLLAERAGFTVERVVFDSGAHQFWGSEQYVRDIPHRSEHSHEDNPNGSSFSREQIRAYEQRSRELNATGEGDSACFYLRRS